MRLRVFDSPFIEHTCVRVVIDFGQIRTLGGEAKRERALPLMFLPDGIVFLRAMELRDDGRVTFMPTILRMTPDADPPMELVASQRVEIRGWRASHVTHAFQEAGFASVETYGSYGAEAFVPEESRDLIVVAR